MLEQQPNQSRLFKFVADPPTTTSQRLKGLTTGSLPTFIEFGKNFNTDALKEDNLMHQLCLQGKRIVGLGDGTWRELFPVTEQPTKHQSQPNDTDSVLTRQCSEDVYTRARFFPSFDVWDLHTVDDGVLRYLYHELNATSATNNDTAAAASESLAAVYQNHIEDKEIPLNANSNDRFSSWDVLIGHFLGVDHAGHRYGIRHPEMIRKLDQMNAVIEETIALLPPETLLLVMGDHGMTDDGDHGGGSPIEVDAALFAYTNSRTVQFTRTATESESRFATIPQIDLVPTLSLLLGVPIPFGNLGKVIPDLLPTSQSLLDALHINSAQVARYLAAYASASPQLPSSQIDQLNAVRMEAERIHTESTIAAIETYYRYLEAAVSMCREMWAVYDTQSMLLGLALLIACFATIIAHVVLLSNVKSSQSIHRMLARAARISVALIACVFITSKLLPSLSLPQLHWLSQMIPSATNDWTIQLWMYGVAILVSYWISLFTTTTNSVSLISLPRLNTVVAITFTVLHAAGFLSNSFIVYEDRIVLFFLTSGGFYYLGSFLYNALSPHLGATNTKNRIGLKSVVEYCAIAAVYLIVLRASTSTMRHRLHGTHIIASITGDRESFQPIAVLISLLSSTVLFGGYCYYRQQHTKSTHQWWKWAVFVYMPFAQLVIFTYWLINEQFVVAVFGGIDESMAHSLRLYLPRVVYGTAVGMLLSLAKHVLALNQHQRHQSRVLNVVAGVAIVHPVLAMISGYYYVHTYTRLSLQIVAFALLVEKHTQHCQSRSGSEARVDWVAICSWNFFALQYFFATGHQNTLNTINWQSAFVGLDQANIQLSGLLVAVNTLGSRLLFAATLPWLFSLFSNNSNNSNNNSNSVKQMGSSSSKNSGRSNTDTANQQTQSQAAIVGYLAMYTTVAVVSTVCVFLQRRHLMLEAIFAPKYLFDAASALIVNAVALAL